MKPTPLSPIDYVFTGVGSYPIAFAFAYQGNIDPDRLRRGLDQTLAHFPLLRSKLIRTEDDAYAFLPAEDGLTFETVQSAETFADTQHVDAFVRPVTTSEGEPLTRVVLTETPAGSVLGVSISHAVVDGFSYFHVLSSWARLVQGQRILEPAHQRGTLIPEPSDRQGDITPDALLARCGLFWDERRRDAPDEPPREERLLISKDRVKALLREAAETCDLPLTDNDVITAALWKRFVPGWCQGQGGNNPVTYVTLPFDFRRPLKAISRTFFGCALYFATASLDYQSLVQASLGELALLVRKAVGGIREDTVWESLRTLDRLRRASGLGVMEEIHVRHPRHGLAVTNISRLPIQGLDFGAGVPSGFHIYTQVLRGAGILPAKDGVEVRVFLPPAGH